MDNEDDLSETYRALFHVLKKRAERGDPPIKRLDISFALVASDNGWLADNVLSLRYDQFDYGESS